MPSPLTMREGGRLLVDQLLIHGVDTVFAVPGESYLPVLDGLYEAQARIRLITCRMEAGAANMAEAYAKLTGRPGICMVTRGPGATHASVGVHTAAQDSSPLILFVGQVGRGMRGREAFQEIDYVQMFGSIAKWVVEIDDAKRIPELVARAFATASSGRPGPVVVALPEDILSSDVAVADARPYRPVRPSPSANEMAEFGRLLAEAGRPLVIVGGATWTQDASADLQAFAERHSLTVAAAFRSQDVFDNEHPLYVGDVGLGVNPKLMQRLRDADLLIALGTRLEENVTAGYSTVAIPCPDNRLVHVHPRTEELGRVYQADLPINAGMPEFLSMARSLEPHLSARSQDWAKELRRDYESYQRPLPAAGAVNMTEIITAMRSVLPPTRSSPTGPAITASGCIAFTVTLARARNWRRHPAPWVMACRPRLRRRSFIPSGLSCRSAAMAVF